MTELAAVDQAMVELEAQLADADQRSEAYLAKRASDDPEQDFADWLTTDVALTVARIEHARQRGKDIVALVTEQTELECRALARYVAHLLYQHGDRLNAKVDADLQLPGNRKKRSVNYAGGKVGYRTTGGKPHIEIEDDELAIKHAATSCPQAVKVTRSLLKGELNAYLKKTGETLPGTRAVTPPKVDVFAVCGQVRQPHLLPEPRPELQSQPDSHSSTDAKAFFASGKPEQNIDF